MVFPLGFLRPGGTVKLYFSVPVELYTVFSVPKTLAKTLVKNLSKKYGPKSGHADHVLKAPL